MTELNPKPEGIERALGLLALKLGAINMALRKAADGTLDPVQVIGLLPALATVSDEAVGIAGELFDLEAARRVGRVPTLPCEPAGLLETGPTSAREVN